MPELILAIDQGTTSSRALIFTRGGQVVAQAQREFRQYFPANGWVEHDPKEIWEVTTAVCREALAQLPSGSHVLGLGITNQRETALIWDRGTGEPIHPAIVWQDRRTAEHCRQLAQEGHEELVSAHTGLLLDPYFSATKISWMLNEVPGARARAERGELAFGTVDTWLIWRLTGGKAHLTDATNASRTMLFDIHRQCWDDELLRLFDIPEAMLPRVLDSAADFGIASHGLGEWRLPIAGVAGDQQAAVVGQACFKPGMVKSTYGTGCFALLQLGTTPIASRNRLLTTVAYRVGGRTHYALEGAIFVAGAAVQWLRDQLGVIQQASETEGLARTLDTNRGVYFVPAFTGLGAPHWQPSARGTVVGLTRDSGRAELARAVLEAVCYQTHDLFVAMADDAGAKPDRLRVDGGMSVNDWMLQALADIVDVPVERPAMVETTALGAARLAGLHLGLYGSLDEVAASAAPGREFTPQLDPSPRQQMLSGWHKAVESSLRS